MPKTIFLDIGGVFITSKCLNTDPETGLVFYDENCLKAFNDLLKQIPDYEIVLISNLVNVGIGVLAHFFRTQGLELVNNRKLHKIRDTRNKSEGIKEWLESNPRENFVIIDDDEITQFKEKQIQTHYSSGFVEKLIPATLNVLLN